MARLLYRLGAGSARRPWVVITAWALVLLATCAGMATLQKPLTNEFKLPGSDFAKVLDHVGTQIPEVSGGVGTVVVRTHDGKPFTAAQKREIADLRTAFTKVDQVTGTVDPFAMQARLERSRSQLAAGHRELVANQKRWDASAHKVYQLRWLVGEGQRDIARLRRTDPGNATLPARVKGQAQLEKLLADGDRKLAASRVKLADGWETYDGGRELVDRASGFGMVNKAGNTALVQVRFDKQTQQVDPANLEKVVAQGSRLDGTGLDVEFGQDISRVSEPGGVGEVVGLVAAGIVLFVMLGSLVLAGLPLVIAFVGVGGALTLGLAATHVFTLHQMAPVLGAMLGLAVGIDYALFIVNRYRRQLGDLPGVPGRRPTRDEIVQSLGLAVGTAGNAVVIAGTTVVIALAALCVSGIPVLMQMGLLAATTVVMTVLVAITLTPALLSLVGHRATPKAARSGRSGSWPTAWISRVTRHPRIAVGAVAVVLLVMAIPALSLRLGLPDGSSEDHDTTAAKAYALVRSEFGAGANGPILVSADADHALRGDDLRHAQLAVARAADAVPGVTAVVPVGTSADHRTLAFQVVSEGGPSSAVTTDVVDALRGQVTTDLARQGLTIGVTGQTVATIEVSQQLAAALPLYLVLVVGLSLLLLTVVFRSLVVPLLATAGFLLSVAASFGAVVAVYQWGWLGHHLGVNEPGAIMSFLPTLLIGILFGLAMDYQMFLVSGMHEAYARGRDARTSVAEGFVSGAKVVAAAALIMTAVFAGFIFSGMTMVRPIGFGLAVGVVIDAFLVRMVLVPAAMTMLGDKAWWMPMWLERLLPHLDVEGSSLTEVHRQLRRPVAEREDELV